MMVGRNRPVQVRSPDELENVVGVDSHRSVRSNQTQRSVIQRLEAQLSLLVDLVGMFRKIGHANRWRFGVASGSGSGSRDRGLSSDLE